MAGAGVAATAALCITTRATVTPSAWTSEGWGAPVIHRSLAVRRSRRDPVNPLSRLWGGGAFSGCGTPRWCSPGRGEGG
jgi:hypothetical protein